MSNIQDENKEINEFEETLNEINEWQNNYSNPGYYVGSGKVPIPIKNIFKSPRLILIVGLIIGVPTFYSIINNFSFENILGNIMAIVISSAFIIGGIIRLKNMHEKNKWFVKIWKKFWLKV